MPPTELAVSRERTVLDECQDAIGYRFQRPELLRAALTHTSGANTRTASNERLEFLGDSVLGLVTCKLLYKRFPEYQEGDLTKIKSVVVSRKTCAVFGRSLGLGKFLFMGKGIARGEIPCNMLADVFEALVAAIFLDGGWEAARDFVLQFVVPEVERVTQGSVAYDSKSQLLHVVQRLWGGSPRYCLLDEQGPDHNKCFKVAADVNGHRFPPAWGRTKKEAESKAAHNALAELEEKEIPFP